MILSVSLSRLSSQLASANRNEVVAKAIRSFGTGFIFPNQFCKDQWSLIEAAMGGPLEHSCCHGKDEVMAAQAFCTTAALGVSPQLPVVWKNFGHILCAIMKVQLRLTPLLPILLFLRSQAQWFTAVL